MSNVNSVRLLGNLGNDPEMRFTKNGTAVTNFRMATNEYRKGTKYTEWHRIVAWAKTATTCAEYLQKGRRVVVDGRLQTRNWTDRDGNQRWTTEIVAHSVTFLDKNPQNASQAQPVKETETEVPEVSAEPELSPEAAALFATSGSTEDPSS